MSNSIIEDSRLISEELDLFESSLTELLLTLDSNNQQSSQHKQQLTHRNKLILAHKSNDLINRIVNSSQSLKQSNSIENEERIREIDALTGGGGTSSITTATTGGGGGGGGGGDLSEFYKRLGKVKEYHRKYPEVASNTIKLNKEVDFTALEGGDEEWLDKKFTSEEGLGRYIDLHELHELWNSLIPNTNTSGSGSSTSLVNTNGWKKLTYLQYLESITSNFNQLSIKLKSNSLEYSKYLTKLLEYLSNFYERIFPLEDLDSFLNQADNLFSKKWELGTVKGWPKIEEGSEEIDNNNNNNNTTMEEKEPVEAGIWCPACQKQYSKQTVYNAHLTSKKHLKASAKLSDPSTSSTTSSTSLAPPPPPPTSASLFQLRQQKNRALALKESLILALLEPPSGPLSTILSETLSNSERRAALTDRERATEMEELEARELAEATLAAINSKKDKMALAVDDEDEDEGRIYNPLKLPMGWDGKPIPFWLFKLHGLGVEYKCEICSDFVYMGRKQFERHFQESKHAFGMRALGLPNTKHFHEITKIEDAIALAEKLKQEGQQETIQAGMTEELEDEDGNVYNRKTYDDLKRQGLL